MSEEKTTYKGFSVGDRVYYYKKGCCPSFGNLIRQELGFQDFVELIKECIDTNCDLLWS